MAWGALIALFLSIAAALVIYAVIKKLWPLFVNGVLGVAAFWLLSYFHIISVPIDWITFLICAIGGVFGVGVVILLVALGVPL